MRQVDGAAVRSMAQAVRVSPLMARLLVARGHTDTAATERHLQASPMGLHDPNLLPGMEAACERLARARRDGETVLVHGDYDVDGVTGTALLMRILKLLDIRCEWHIPNRLVDGYSFGDHSIERARETGAKVCVSVDNGTSAHTVIAKLLEQGVDTIVTDHHEAPEGPLPDATAIVNPKLADSKYPWRELCGGAVAFKLAWGLAQKINGKKRVSGNLKAFLEEATSYVAIATVCDVVPLLDENRIFARFGLKALERSNSHGLQALLGIANLKGRRLTAEDVGFQIGPRINASGRLGSAQKALELLLSEDAATARRLAVELDVLNRRRREIEREVLIEAREAAKDYQDPIEHPVLVLAGEGWHQGVVGIVAARLTEEYGRPAIVIGLDGTIGRGSARTVGEFHVLEAMSAAAPHVERFGGHAQAAGLEIKADKVDDARAAIEARAKEMLKTAGHAQPSLVIDADLAFEDMNLETMRHLDLLAPFGANNEKPVLRSHEVYLAQPPRAVGQDANHLMLHLRRGNHVLKGMAFKMGKRLQELSMGNPIDVVYSPRWNTFRGETNLEIEVMDFKPLGEGICRISASDSRLAETDEDAVQE